MTNLIKFTQFSTFISVLALMLSSCSSLDKKDYQVTTLQSVGNALLTLADEKRQRGEYQEAFVYYLEAEKYALKRNDKYSFGLSQLKRASLHIKLSEFAEAQKLITAVNELQQFEAAGLENALLFVEAQFAHHQGQTEQALTALAQLQKNYAKNEEKRLYYQFVSWVYSPDSVALSTIEQSYKTLLTLKQQGQMSNIEIFSYAVSHYGRYLAQQESAKTKSVLDQAISHFSMLEQSNNIAQMYDVLAEYYGNQSETEKSQYYRAQAERIRNLKVI